MLTIINLFAIFFDHIPGIKRKIDKNVNDLIKKERSAVNISSVNREDWEKIQAYTGLNINVMEPNVGSNPVNNIPAFQWNDLTERAQKDRYIPHLRDTILRLATNNRTVELVDTSNQNNYLGTLSGTTDAVISDRRAVQHGRDTKRNGNRLHSF